MSSGYADIGILYPGEMGLAIASALHDCGFQTVTCLSGRSSRTMVRAESVAMRIVPTLRELIEQSEIILSVVPPAAAASVAESVCNAVSSLDGNLSTDRVVCVDVNSISPQAARVLAVRCASCGLEFVDAAIHGQAGNLRSGATLYVSGARAGEIAELFGTFMRVRALGDQPGKASEIKMVLGGLSKGMCGLFFEVASLAQRCGSLRAALEEMRHFYPDLLTPLARMLPSYLDHAVRRAQEMREFHAMARAAQQDCHLVPGLSELFDQLAAAVGGANRSSDSSIESIIKFIVDHGFLDSARQSSTRAAV